MDTNQIDTQEWSGALMDRSRIETVYAQAIACLARFEIWRAQEVLEEAEQVKQWEMDS